MTDLVPSSDIRTPVHNAALWLSALFSGGLALLGTWVILDRLPGMEAVLDDGTATPSQVYGGQSWIVVGAAVLGAGLVGLALTLAVAARLASVRRTTLPDRTVVLDAETAPVADPDAIDEPVDAADLSDPADDEVAVSRP